MRYLSVAFYIIVLSFFSFVPAEKITVKGTVLDKNTSHPLAGVSVTIHGTRTGTVTDNLGKFTIAVESGDTLLFSSLGHTDQVVVVKKSSDSLVVLMESESRSLDEVVVTGYAGVLRGKASGIAVKSKRLNSVHTNYDREDEYNTEEYSSITENAFREVKNVPLSTFSIDVDAASYSNMRRFLNQGQLPPAGSVRIEEMINYFHYDYPQPAGEDPFSINTEISDCTWNKEHKIVMIGLQGKTIPVENLPAVNLVFLIDVSGSMSDENKLPLVKSSLKLLVNQLREADRVSIVVYAGNAGLVLPSVSGSEKQTIRNAIDNLEAGGSTAGGEGILLAYKIANQNFIKEGNNRVILCSDGDFNVGASSDASLEKMIENERESGIYLTVLGYGMGNYKDSKMQKLADKGNGNHAYIDNENEAKKVLVNEFGSTLFTIAKDVKLQVEFNPAKVQAYRLIGYENRLLNTEDFDNDRKDAGELGSGHTVTALYEIIPVGVKSSFIEKTTALRYQQSLKHNNYSSSTNEVMNVKIRYKRPKSAKSMLTEKPINDNHISLENTSDNFRFAVAVAEFGMLLTNSSFKQASNFEDVISLGKDALGTDREGYRNEFVKLAELANQLAIRK